MINNKHTTCSDKIEKGMIIRRRLATDYTNFTHKSHIFKAFSEINSGRLVPIHRNAVSRFAMFTDLKQPKVVLFVLIQKNL
ncbi:MAG: hypothetical protein A2033_10705 [Bacteroidetes bacterium GWA2_31_9]|nr:MAG: hypothetical protein A2033_10705 [Bacteroidetes bacterium GWA2_31_9]